MDPSNFSTITYTINITNYSSELDTNISIFDEVNQDSRSINYPDTIWLMVTHFSSTLSFLTSHIPQPLILFFLKDMHCSSVPNGIILYE